MNAPDPLSDATALAPSEGALDGCAQDPQSATRDWQPLQSMIDGAYPYASPDHERLPPDTDRIPYSFRETRPNSEDPGRF